MEGYGIGTEPELIIKLDLSFDSSLFTYRSPLRCLLLFLSVISGPFIKKEKNNNNNFPFLEKECFNEE